MHENYSFLKHLITEDIFLVREKEQPKTDPSEEPEQTPAAPESVPGPAIAFYGKNAKHIVLAVDEAGAEYFSSECKPLLTNILDAIKLTFDDVALINLKRSGNSIDLNELISQFGCKTVIAFGIDPKRLIAEKSSVSDEPFEQKGVRILFTYSLKELMQNRNFKKSLWNNLKAMFNV